MARKKKTIEVEQEADAPKGILEKLGVTNPEELSSRINRDFDSSEQIKYQWIPERNKDVKDYYGVIQPSEWPFKGASRIKSQFQRIVVDTLSGNLLKSIFLPEHPIKAAPAALGNKSTDDVLDNVKYVEDLHNSLQNTEYKLHSVLDKAIPTSLIESFVVLSPVYEYRTNEIVVDVTRWVPEDVDVNSLTYDLDTDSVSTIDGQAVPSLDMTQEYMEEGEAKATGMKEVQFSITKEECIKDGVTVNIINGYRFYMPLGSPGETPYEKVQRAPFVIHQLFYTVREVLDFSENGFFENVDIPINALADEYNKKNGKQGKPVVPATTYDRQREIITHTKMQQAGFVLDVARLEYEYVEVLKWSGKWKINGKTRDVFVWMDRNTGTILRVEQNIFGIKPYFPIVPFPIDETPYGESLCKIIRPLVQELDLLMRIVTNIALMKSAPPKFYDPASGFNPSTIGNMGPNSWIPAREPARNVLIPPQPEDPQVSMQMIQLLINIIERITGVNEVIQGQVSQKSNTTATEVQNALVRSGVRFDTLYERLKDQINPLFKYVHRLTLRYMSEKKEIQLMGTENRGRFVAIHKSQIQGAYEFELQGNSIVTEQTELQNALALYNTLGQHPYLSYKPESIYYVLYNIVKRLNPIAMDKILPKPQEVAELERSRAVTQQEQEQMAQQQQANQPNPAMVQAQHQMQLKQAETEQKLQQNDQSHKQKLTHEAEKHAQAMAIMQQQMIAEQQKAEIQHAEMIRRARDQAKKADDNSKS